MLKVISPDEAVEIIRNEFSSYRLQKESLPLSHSLSRTLCEDIISKENIPSFNRSTVDGYALFSADSFGSSESSPSQLDIAGEVLMGEKTDLTVHRGECVKIPTGGMLPEGADSVIMLEHTDTLFDGICLAQKAVSPYENVTRKGDDIKENDTVLKKGSVITSRSIGVLAALGISEVSVFCRPSVGIISTGDELVSADSEAAFGKIRDINSHILSALMRELGCETTFYGIIKDDFGEIDSTLKKAVKENDIVLISGGSSAGAADMTADIINASGELLFHGLAMKPGKPTIFGKIDGKAVFGLPGHPAAAYFVALRLIKPLICTMLCTGVKTAKATGELTQNISSNHGREEIVCVRLRDGKITPLFAKSGIISLLSQSDGYIIIERNREGLRQGENVEVNLF